MASKKSKAVQKIEPVEAKPLKLNMGSGGSLMEGFFQVDMSPGPHVDLVMDIGTTPWPWSAETVDEIWCRHAFEHLKPQQRLNFVNEAYRVLKPDGFITMITPHWTSARAYGDLTHEWPPVCEMSWYYLNEDWRNKEASHTNKDYCCNFEATWGYQLRGDVTVKNQEYQMFAMQNFVQAIEDMHATLRKKPRL